MFRFQKLETGILIDGDEALLSKIEGEDLSSIDISDLKIDAQTLGEQYLIAESTPHTVGKDSEIKKDYEAKRYAVLKSKYLEMYGAL